MADDTWVVSGKSQGTPPERGAEYEVHCARKGTFNGRILEINGPFALLEVTKGMPTLVSIDYKYGYNGVVSVRSGLTYFIPIIPSESKE